MHVLDRGKKYCTTWMKGLCDPLNRFTRPSQKRVFTVPNRLTNTFFPSFFFIPFKGIFAYGLVTNILSYETLRPLFVNVYTDTCVYNVYVYIYISQLQRNGGCILCEKSREYEFSSSNISSRENSLPFQSLFQK